MSSKRLFAALLLGTSVLFGVIYAQQNSEPAKPGTEKAYALGPGDVLEIKVFGQPDLSVTAQIDSEGNLSSLPFLEPIRAKCRPERQIQSDIATAYLKLVNTPQVSVRLVERNSHPPATVFGAVRQQAKVQTHRAVRLNEAIAAAGGFAENTAGTIQVIHTEPVMCPGPGQEDESLALNGTGVPMQVIKISDLQKGNTRANLTIRPGDLVLVTEADPVYIIGTVVSPGALRLRENLTLTRALGMVGGPRNDAQLSDIRIFRQRPGSTGQDIIKVDFDAIKKNKRPDVLLMPFDVVEVSEQGFLASGTWKDVFMGIFFGSLRNSVPARIPF